MFFGILEDSGKLEYNQCRASFADFVAQRNHAGSPLPRGSFPVGLVPEAEFTTASLQLEPDDTLVLFSDGVTEAMDPEEELYGVSRLRAVLQGKTELPLDEIQKTVLESVENFARGARQADDLTILVVRYRAVATGITEAGVATSKSAAASD